MEKVLQAQSNAKKINIARDTDGKEENTCANKDDNGLQLMGKAKTAMKEVLDMNVNLDDTLTLNDRIDMLNPDQSRVFHEVKNHFLHQLMQEASECKCDLSHFACL